MRNFSENRSSEIARAYLMHKNEVMEMILHFLRDGKLHRRGEILGIISNNIPADLLPGLILYALDELNSKNQIISKKESYQIIKKS